MTIARTNRPFPKCPSLSRHKNHFCMWQGVDFNNGSIYLLKLTYDQFWYNVGLLDKMDVVGAVRSRSVALLTSSTCAICNIQHIQHHSFRLYSFNMLLPIFSGQHRLFTHCNLRHPPRFETMTINNFWYSTSSHCLLQHLQSTIILSLLQTYTPPATCLSIFASLHLRILLTLSLIAPTLRFFKKPKVQPTQPCLQACSTDGRYVQSNRMW